MKPAGIANRDPGGARLRGPRDEALDQRAKEALARGVEELKEAQELLWASDRYAVLVVLQAMDAAGKDSAIEHVMSGVNPQGVQVFGFKKPSAEELDHDFLWRAAKALPERGRIGIFNRSHYEEVVALRVHPELLTAQRLPAGDRRRAFWQERYEDINAFERHLDRNGTKIVKLFLHVSKDGAEGRFLARLDTPGKEWKFNAADVAERARWDDYMARVRARRSPPRRPRGRRGTSSRPTPSGSPRRSSRSCSPRRSTRWTCSWPEVTAAGHAANLEARRRLEAESGG